MGFTAWCLTRNVPSPSFLVVAAWLGMVATALRIIKIKILRCLFLREIGVPFVLVLVKSF